MAPVYPRESCQTLVAPMARPTGRDRRLSTIAAITSWRTSSEVHRTFRAAPHDPFERNSVELHEDSLSGLSCPNGTNLSTVEPAQGRGHYPERQSTPIFQRRSHPNYGSACFTASDHAKTTHSSRAPARRALRAPTNLQAGLSGTSRQSTGSRVKHGCGARSTAAAMCLFQSQTLVRFLHSPLAR